MARKDSPFIVFRTDSSLTIGNGHVMRCLTLASMLRERGALCMFICRPFKGHLIEYIERQGFSAISLPNISTLSGDIGDASDSQSVEHWLGTDFATDANDTINALSASVDLLVIDHYAIDKKWETVLRPRAKNLMVVDDLANRPHDCDILLDQNIGSKSANYDRLLPAGVCKLIGPRYALLRPQFLHLRDYSLSRRQGAMSFRVLISLGGVDRDNVTQRVITALHECKFESTLELTIVMGPNAPWIEEVISEAKKCRHSTTVLSSVTDMASLMADSDLAIGAAGSTSWERCALGVPTLLLILAQNQLLVAKRLEEAGGAMVMPIGANFVSVLENFLTYMTSDSGARQKMINIASRICDGRGTMRVADTIWKFVFHQSEEVTNATE